jgi:hypothetical protein
VADRMVLAEVNGPLGQVRPRPIGITAAAVILIVLWSTPFLEGAIASLRCTILLLSKPTQCDSAMHVLALEHDWSGYTSAGTALAFGALGVIAGVRLLGLRSRGLALSLAWVGILMWLAVLAFVPGPHPGLGSRLHLRRMPRPLQRDHRGGSGGRAMAKDPTSIGLWVGAWKAVPSSLAIQEISEHVGSQQSQQKVSTGRRRSLFMSSRSPNSPNSRPR